jgi:hypothetical protein
MKSDLEKGKTLTAVISNDFMYEGVWSMSLFWVDIAKETLVCFKACLHEQ